MAVSGLYTTVKNTSGAARVFGFLGAHGKRLENNETYTVPGDLVASLGNSGKGQQRSFKSLEKALADGSLQIVNSPAVYVTDSVDGSVDQIEVADDAVTVAEPDGWDS